MNNSTEIISLAKDIFKWCIQHFFKTLSMPLRLIFYTRIGERQLTANIIPYWLGIALLLLAGFLDGSVLYPGWHPSLPFAACLTLLSVGMWFFQYWQFQYFHTTNPKKVWPSNSIGVPRFFHESGPIPQRWTQPLLLLGIGSLYYLLRPLLSGKPRPYFKLLPEQPTVVPVETKPDHDAIVRRNWKKRSG